MKNVLIAGAIIAAIIIYAVVQPTSPRPRTETVKGNSPPTEKLLELDWNVDDGMGHIKGEPPGDVITGVCSSLSHGYELQCDIYNGLHSWTLTQVFIAVRRD